MGYKTPLGAGKEQGAVGWARLLMESTGGLGPVSWWSL